MKSIGTTGESSTLSGDGPEVRIKGRAVSRGVAIGKVVCLHGANRQFFRVDLPESEIPPEIQRLRAAIEIAKLQIAAIISTKPAKYSESVAEIFETHRMLLEDRSFHKQIENEVASQKINSEWAIKLVTERHAAKYKLLQDEHLRNRYMDIEDVFERVLIALGGSKGSVFHFAKNSIIAARELRPSTMVELADVQPAAVITENGGWTSHAFILARELNWPAVTGLKNILRRVNTGDEIIVDGYNGQLILNPEKSTMEKFTIPASAFDKSDGEGIGTQDKAVATLDGHSIKILANSDLPETYKTAKRLGAQGIGLYRSEFLFNKFHGFPSEAEQIAAYRKIAALAGQDGVKIRTFDLAADQIDGPNFVRENNPALGLRAVRLGLTFNTELKCQLRAILVASAGHQIDIVLPMISGVSEILEIRKFLEEQKQMLLTEARPFGNPGIGAMIEVPSAVLMIKEIAEETDFLCLGTNDLIQYLLAADRDNEAVSDWFRTLHPAVLRAIRTVIRAGIDADKSVIVCGEMAGSPYYVPVLLGLGATELSMNFHSIEKVRKVISGIALEECRELAKSFEAVGTVEEIEEIAHRRISTNWAHLYPPNFLPAIER